MSPEERHAAHEWRREQRELRAAAKRALTAERNAANSERFRQWDVEVDGKVSKAGRYAKRPGNPNFVRPRTPLSLI